MNNDNLIRMANQIGVFFESMPDRTEAMRDLAMHLKKFWDPRMRKAFLNLMDGNAGDQISDIVRSAAFEHRALLA
ncbi:MAG TPA: formate dehydrogenase [Polaromonas sp.]|nr:formate dehydrogenase [Polaromonas sp.]